MREPQESWTFRGVYFSQVKIHTYYRAEKVQNRLNKVVRKKSFGVKSA